MATEARSWLRRSKGHGVTSQFIASKGAWSSCQLHPRRKHQACGSGCQRSFEPADHAPHQGLVEGTSGQSDAKARRKSALRDYRVTAFSQVQHAGPVARCALAGWRESVAA